MRTCSKCRVAKAATCFGAERRTRDGLQAECRECRRKRGSAHAKAKRAADPEAARAAKRRQYAERRDHYREYARKKAAERRARDPEADRAKSLARYYADPSKARRYREANRDRYRENDRAWRAANRERVRQYAKNRRATQPELDVARAMRRRAREIGAPGRGVSGQEWAAILDCFGHRCAYCLAKATSLEMDHVIALSRGGAHDPSNIVPACSACNSSKKARPLIGCFAASLIVAQRMGNHFHDAA
jgi:5-methylcytosine-specific restriction endonuclease McrA